MPIITLRLHILNHLICRNESKEGNGLVRYPSYMAPRGTRTRGAIKDGLLRGDCRLYVLRLDGGYQGLFCVDSRHSVYDNIRFL